MTELKDVESHLTFVKESQEHTALRHLDLTSYINLLKPSGNYTHHIL
jgi:hypothetical protein